MQTVVSSLSPSHGSPPFAGGGFVQVRTRCRVPLLQVTLHRNQRLHGE